MSMDTFNTFNPEPEALEKSRWFTGPTFAMFLIGVAAGVSLNSFVGGAPFGDEVVESESSEEVLAETTEGEVAGKVTEDVTKSLGAVLFGGKDTKKSAPVVEGENLLVVSNQPAGTIVVTSMVSLGASGWVAVHENNADGSFGKILGARRFNAGKYFGESIELLRATVEDNSYYVVLHADDGDTMFDFSTETPVKDKGGSFVSGTFIATENMAE